MDPLDARAARVAALDALARRDHAAAELRQKLIDKGFDPLVAGEVLNRLLTEKLVDDARYIESYVSLHAARGQGPLRIRADLKRMGLPDDRVSLGLDAYRDWGIQLQKARAKKFGARLPNTFPESQRQARFLGYRGFTSAQIRMALGLDTDTDVDL